jgi:hypothetical protein
MTVLRVIYELVRVAYTGESIGEDWTFYLHTGAGLVCLDSKLGPGGEDRRIRVIGVREVEIEADEDGPRFERELWWASATEHDPAVPDHGAGLFVPVSIPLEAEVEIWRSLEFDVAETGPAGRTRQTAHLRFDVRARVEVRGDEPSPKLDATPLVGDAAVPKPQQTAGELPESFAAEVEGVEAMIPVVGRRRQLVGRDYAGDDPRGLVLANFLTHHSGGFLPGWFEPRAALYELSNIDELPFWAGENSSMGLRNHRISIEAFAEAAPPLGAGLRAFEVRRSLLAELLGHAHTAELGPAASAIAELIAELVSQHPERATVERQVFVRTATIDEHSGEWTRVLFVDPTPFAGPDTSLWMVAWTDAWTE